MIIDKLKNLSKYAPLNAGFADIAEFVAKNDLLSLPLGKTNISDKAFLNRQSYVGKEESNDLYESHINYIDVQVVLQNREKMNFSFDAPVIGEKNEKDAYFTESKNKMPIEFNEGDMVIFFPNELHKPCLKLNEDKIEKIVFKVKAE